MGETRGVLTRRVASRVAFALTLGLAFAACSQADAPPPGSTPGIDVTGDETSLYRRLGGYDALAAVTDSFLVRLQGDPAVSVFFAGLDPVQMNRIRQMVVDQLCAATGGPCRYVGKSMREAHATLDITNDVFEKFMGHMQSTLVAFAVPQREQDELLGALNSLKTEIVTK